MGGGWEEGRVRAGLRESRAWLEEIWSKLPLPSPATCLLTKVPGPGGQSSSPALCTIPWRGRPAGPPLPTPCPELSPLPAAMPPGPLPQVALAALPEGYLVFPLQPWIPDWARTRGCASRFRHWRALCGGRSRAALGWGPG